MGEYWQVCNLTKREAYDTRGHYNTRGTMTYEMRGALLWLIGTNRWSESDDIRLLSDYGDERLINKETWEVTEGRGDVVSEVQIRELVDIHFEVIGARVEASEVKVSIGGIELKPITAIAFTSSEPTGPLDDDQLLDEIGKRFFGRPVGLGPSTNPKLVTPAMILNELRRLSGRDGWAVELHGSEVSITPPKSSHYEPESEEG